MEVQVDDSYYLTERDSCGVGFIADLNKRGRHDVLRLALRALSNLQHRGAVAADAETGDGAGVLFQLPTTFFRREAARLGSRLEPAEPLGVGMFFLPKEEETKRACREIVGGVFARQGLRLIGWRQVPVDLAALGAGARATCPTIEQAFLSHSGMVGDDGFERRLYLARKKIERAFAEAGVTAYAASLSHRTIVYKGLLSPAQLGRFYVDLQQLAFQPRFAIFHQRFSTNTLPSWFLAQPFRMLAHNGEINTLLGNCSWMRAREQELRSVVWGEEVEHLKPVIWQQGSDSARLDNMLELLVLSGRSVLQAMAMLVPEAYQNVSGMDEDLRAFYEYHECLMEPWDGPAALSFTDGRIVGAALDRNGLRPARYVRTDDGLMVMASEVGTLPIKEERIIEKGRLGPGMMIAVDTVRGSVIKNDEIKQRLARGRSYARWVDRKLLRPPEFRFQISDFRLTSEVNPQSNSTHSVGCNPPSASPSLLLREQRAFGYTIEDLQTILKQMVVEKKEPTGSMGDDTPLSVLSAKPRLLYTYFKQLFAQVTNPPIDPLRERLVMSLETLLGKRGNLLEESPSACRLIKLGSPLLTRQEFDWIQELNDSVFTSETLQTLFPVSKGPSGLGDSLHELCRDAERAASTGVTLLILSDRGTSREYAPIPMLMAVGAVHHHLIRVGLRMRVSLVVETGEAREDHHFACLLGYGASAIYPYLAYETVLAIAAEEETVTPEEALGNYKQALEKSLLKIMSKMGISVLASYQGAQIFEAIGLAEEVIADCFAGTPSRIGGVGYEELAAEIIARHAVAFGESKASRLDDHGFYRFRKQGEYHAFNPEVIRALHRAVRNGDNDAFKEYTRLVEERPPMALRDLLEFQEEPFSLSADQVESVEEILKRFSTSGMSHGALSREAHETVAVAMNRLGAKSNSGEGGEDPTRYRPRKNGDLPNSAVKQVASARFGVTPEYLVSARELEIKIAQGSKPGEGGQLPGHKVSSEIARIRHSVPGVTLISPPPHHDIYSIEDLAQLIYDLRQVNPEARIAVKLVSEAGIGTIAAGVVKAGADVIHISGHDGGTGASPLGSIKNAGIPWELGLAEVQQALVANDLRSRVVLRVDGGLKTGRDVVIAAMLGADEFGFGTAPLVAAGCVMARQCHLNTCPVGVATQREELRAKFPGKPEHVIRFFQSVAFQVREILTRLGFCRLEEVVGRTDLLWPRKELSPSLNGDLAVVAPAKKTRVYLSRVVKRRELGEGQATQFVSSVKQMNRVLDDQIIGDAARSLDGQESVSLNYEIQNTDRAVGAKLAGEIARRYGDHGLSGQQIEIAFRGTAGQSFGAFCLPGMRLVLIGDANDYVGKGMHGGEIIVRPPEAARFPWHENVIMGNTVMYGATGGHLFVAGQAGERFAVRNSGAVAVVEGVGDHGCEYMTGGLVVVLGQVGRNFAAGMTGGIAFVLDERGGFEEQCNPELVRRQRVNDDDVELIRALITAHWTLTGSARAHQILEDFEEFRPLFVRVVPDAPAAVSKPIDGWSWRSPYLPRATSVERRVGA